MQEKKVAIGIDIGGTNTKIGWVDRKGKMLAQNTINTSEYKTFNDLIKKVFIISGKVMCQEAAGCELTGIGIGAPNGNYYKGTIEFAPNLLWKGIIPITEITQKVFNLPAYLTNDANAAAIGEMIYGGAKGMKDFIIVTIGTGLGSGFVANGRLIYGHDGFAGELGHVTVDPGGRICGCGRRGCLEAYASAKGICLNVKEILEKHPGIKSCLTEKPDFTAKDITNAAKKGDEVALLAYDRLAAILGAKLADVVAITSPQAIFLFGGLAQSGNILIKPVKKYMEENLMQIFKNKVQIMKSLLNGSDAAILGASALVWSETDHQY